MNVPMRDIPFAMPGFGALLLALVTAPIGAFLLLSASWLAGFPWRERSVARLTSATFLLMTAASAWIGWGMLAGGLASIRYTGGIWLEVANYEFPLGLVADRLSMPLIILTCVLVGLVGSFSVRYIHREKGFLRFFLLLHVFAFGMLLLLAAGSVDLLIAGWELVGITSVLLIAFFHERPGPVRSAIHVFSMYKIGDLGLLLGIFFVYAAAGSSQWTRLVPGEWPRQTSALPGSSAVLVGLLFLLAAAAKSAQFPFSGWLPRAMEGPTPSSAIFYGALSIHAGAYLLLRIEPLIAATPVVAIAVIALGIVSALIGTLSHRVAPDAKTSIAYAAMTQLGIVFIEIGLGFPRLALAHMVGHAVVRTLQFLRAPSMLHDYHRVHAAAGGHVGATGETYARLVPAPVQLWLYRFGLHRGFYDAAAERFIVRPTLALSKWLAEFEPRFGAPGKASPPSTGLPQPKEALAGRHKN